MGEIKNGTISGHLPSTKTFAVHFPGYPSSVSRAVEALGGAEAISKARSSGASKLELRFRPEDPFCHPAFGEIHPCHSFLLKLSKSSKRRDASVSQVGSDAGDSDVRPPEDQPARVAAGLNAEEHRTRICADVVARVSEAYHFEGMVDYQHVVAVHADNARRKKKRSTEADEPSFGKDGLMGDIDDVMMLVPPLFSPKDVPTTLALSRPPASSTSKRKLGAATECVEVVERCWALDFKIKEIPKKVNWQERMLQGSDEWKQQMAVSKLFDERPIWPKRSLYEKLLQMGFKLGDLLLKRSSRLLVNVAYYFNNGPFLKFWIRKGYDPREDPDSRIYQGIDFRVPQQLQSYCDSTATDELTHRWEDICAFRVFPHKCQMSLQLFELVDEYIQQEIRNSPGQKSCTLKTGWFSDYVFDSLRQRIMIRFLSVFPKPGAESLLKQASERFEKLKKMRFIDNTAKVYKEKAQQEKGRENAADADNEEEPEEIDDNVEEENNGYENLDMVAEEGNISLQSFPYTDMENISKTYLQELFGSFPSIEEHGLDMQNTDEIDGAYEVYEQGSDENYSDDYEDED